MKMSLSDDNEQSGDPKEEKYKTVIRALVIEVAKSQKQLGGLQMLAKICRNLEETNEKLKERAMNYEIGMTRAERRSAQLQEELYRQRGISGISKVPSSAGNTAFEAPAFLPSSIKGLIDSLTNENVRLTKALNQQTEHLKGAALVKKNQENKEIINRLREEMSIKSQTIDHLKIQLESSFQTDTSGGEEVGRQILKLKEEGEQFERKIRSYQMYIKQLRDKNTHLLQLLIDSDISVDHHKKEPAESSSSNLNTRVKEEGISDSGRRMSEVACQTTLFVEEILEETRSGVDVGMKRACDPAPAVDVCSENQILREVNEKQNAELKARDSETVKYEKLLSDLTRYCEVLKYTVEEGKNNLAVTKARLDEIQAECSELKDFKTESEIIIAEMQKRVDHVNQLSSGRSELLEQLEQFKRKSEDVDLMRQVLSNYESEIKEYGQERNDLVEEIERVKNDKIQLLQRLTQLQQEADQKKIKRATSPYRSPPYTSPYNSPTKNSQMGSVAPAIREPWQDVPWNAMPKQMMQVSADGAARTRANQVYRPDSPTIKTQFPGIPKEHSQQSYRVNPISPDHARSHCQDSSRRREDTQNTLPQQHDDQHGDGTRYDEGTTYRSEMPAEEHDQFFDAPSNEHTLKCETCGEKYPSSLFEDHLRDCGI